MSWITYVGFGFLCGFWLEYWLMRPYKIHLQALLRVRKIEFDLETMPESQRKDELMRLVARAREAERRIVGSAPGSPSADA